VTKLFHSFAKVALGGEVYSGFGAGVADSEADAASKAARDIAEQYPGGAIHYLRVGAVPDDQVLAAADAIRGVSVEPTKPEDAAILGALGVANEKWAAYVRAEEESDDAHHALALAVRKVHPRAGEGDRIVVGGRSFHVYEMSYGGLDLEEVSATADGEGAA
jgi:hypothetical protein